MLVMEIIAPELGAPRTPRVEVKFLNSEGQPIEEHRTLFDISTYRKVTKNSASINVICDLNNQFFASLPEEVQFVLYNYFKQIKELLGNVTEGTLNSTISAMSDLTENVFLNNDIPNKLIRFVTEVNVPFPPFEKKELRPQDTQEKTFVYEDYVEITAISIMCKLLCPILGESIVTFKPPITDKENKEFSAFMVFSPVLSAEKSPFHRVWRKLRNYLIGTISTAMSSMNNNPNNVNTSITFMMTKNGFCDNRFEDLICSIIMTKKLVTFDIFKTEVVGKMPNIMTYVHVVTSETTLSKLSSIQSGTNMMPRFDPTDSGNQEDNTTNLENTARISRVSYDIPIMAQVATGIEVDRIINDYNLDRTVFDKSVAYYMKNLISPSPFNRAIISSLLGQRIGGSQMLLYLTMPYYLKLMLATQMILIDWGFSNLAILLSSQTPDHPRTEPMSSVAQRIDANHNKTQEFLKSSRLFPGFSEKILEAKSETGRKIQESQFISYAEQLKRIMDWIIDYDHRYNIPPVLWSYMKVTGERPMAGDLIELDENIMKDLCSFFTKCHEPRLEAAAQE